MMKFLAVSLSFKSILSYVRIHTSRHTDSDSQSQRVRHRHTRTHRHERERGKKVGGYMIDEKDDRINITNMIQHDRNLRSSLKPEVVRSLE